MTKPRWMLGLEELAAELRAMAAARRSVTPSDAAADGLDAAAACADAKVYALQNPTTLLTPAQYAAEQEPPVDESTVRRWCARGELDCEKEGKSYRIPATARREPRPLQLADPPSAAAEGSPSPLASPLAQAS